MRFRNSPANFGLLSKLFHWLLALAIIGLLIFGTVLADMKVSLSNLYLFGLHKSLGLTVFALIILRVLWNLYSKPPSPLPVGSAIWSYLAKGVHILMYLFMIALPLSGWIASSASVFGMRYFDLFNIPQLVGDDPDLEKLGFVVHGFIGNVLVGLIVLHLAGVILRQVIVKDSTLRRMWF